MLRSLRDDGLLLPRHQTSGVYAGQLVWKKLSDAALYDILRNPATLPPSCTAAMGRTPIADRANRRA